MADPKKRISFAKMWSLVEQHYDNQFTDKEVSKELLIAIFWEETLFSNARQEGWTEGATGFGQTEEETISRTNKFFGDHWTAEAVLQSDKLGVQLTQRVLKMYRSLDGKGNRIESPTTVREALNRYAGVGGLSGAKKAKHIAIVNGWLVCERKLKALEGDFTDVKKVKDALRASRMSNDFGFAPTFPLDGKTFFFIYGNGQDSTQSQLSERVKRTQMLGGRITDGISIHTNYVVQFGEETKMPGDPLETNTEKARMMRCRIISINELDTMINV